MKDQPCKAISLLQDKTGFQNTSQGVKETECKYTPPPPAIFGYITHNMSCQLVLADTKHTIVTAM